MAARWGLGMRDSSSDVSCERTSSRRGTQESRRTSAPHVRHDLVRRLSTPQHAAPLVSGLFRDPFPRVGTSAIPDAIQLCLHILRRNRPAFRLNPHLSGHFIPAMTPRTRRFLRVNISPTNPVTGCIPMKTLIKPRMPFFPSCIMGLGALASSECAACGDTPTRLPATLAPDFCARGSSLLAVCRASDL